MIRVVSTPEGILSRLRDWAGSRAIVEAVADCDVVFVGSLLGLKTVLNELIAYLQMSRLPADALDPRSRLIMVYAMCGFANFGSLGIMIGGLGTMAPQRRDEINALGLKSIVSGTLTTCLLGAIVGVLT